MRSNPLAKWITLPVFGLLTACGGVSTASSVKDCTQLMKDAYGIHSNHVFDSNKLLSELVSKPSRAMCAHHEPRSPDFSICKREAEVEVVRAAQPQLDAFYTANNNAFLTNRWTRANQGCPPITGNSPYPDPTYQEEDLPRMERHYYPWGVIK